MKDDQRASDYQVCIESFLKEYCEKRFDLPQTVLFDSIQYSLLAGGKRIRPILAFEFCRISGGEWQKALPFAAAVEMIHTYSLIHDDLPAMDNDDFRRGKPTNHRVYGEAMAILAGDGLLTDAFAVAAQADVSDMPKAITLLSQCAGSDGMVGGQVLDILSENRELTEQEVLDIQSRKTGGLIKAACCLGAMAGGATQEQLEAAGRFAEYLGLAFQIRDDILDQIGTEEEMGKGIGTDQNKNTFVKLYGVDDCSKLVGQYTDMALDALSAFQNTEFLRSMAQDLTVRRN